MSTKLQKSGKSSDNGKKTQLINVSIELYKELKALSQQRGYKFGFLTDKAIREFLQSNGVGK